MLFYFQPNHLFLYPTQINTIVSSLPNFNLDYVKNIFTGGSKLNEDKAKMLIESSSNKIQIKQRKNYIFLLTLLFI